MSASARRKTAKDPYLTLGVPRNCSSDAVKQAYRRQAKKTHPDAGGSAAQFDEVKRAYLVLCDPPRRAHFDETGEIDDPAPDNAEAQAIGLINQVLLAILTGDDDPFRVDLVAAMKGHFRKEMDGIRKRLKVVRRAVERSDKMANRFHRRAGVNMVADALQWHGRHLRGEIVSLEKQICVRELANDLLSDYRYEWDAEKVVWRFTATTTSSSTTTA